MVNIGKTKRVIENEPEPVIAMNPRAASLLGADKILHSVREKITVAPIKVRELVRVKRI